MSHKTTIVSKCIECPFLNDACAYEWGDYGCNISNKVSSEMKTKDISQGVSPKCPLRNNPMLVELSEKKST